MTTSAMARGSSAVSAIGCHILLVEDLLLSQEIARSVLEAGGYTVSVAANGIEAIDAVRDHSYGLVLMDLNLPGMDGYATTARIRDLPEVGGCLPVMALTARGGAEEVERCRRAGMVGHVKKPFAPTALLDAVRTWVPRRGNEPRAGSDPWDRVTYGHLVDRLGDVRLEEALLIFRASLTSLRDVIGSPQPDHRAIDRACHGLTSTSGMLGFARLSAVSRRVMIAGSATDTAWLDELRRALDEVFLCLDARPSALSAGGRSPGTTELSSV